jgi:hypothetical protein
MIPLSKILVGWHLAALESITTSSQWLEDKSVDPLARGEDDLKIEYF